MASLGILNIPGSALFPADTDTPVGVAALIGSDNVNETLKGVAFDETTEANVLTDTFLVPVGTVNVRVSQTFRAITAPGAPVTDERFRWYSRQIDTGAALAWSSAVDLALITVAADAHKKSEDSTYAIAALGLVAGGRFQLAFSRKIGGSLTGLLGLLHVDLEFLDA